MTDNINHPSHYTRHPSGVECIEITEHMGFNLGNTVKYVWRADLKNDDIEDLKKAAWYLDREIQRREKQRDKASTNTEAMPVYEPRPNQNFAKSATPTRKIPDQFIMKDNKGNLVWIKSPRDADTIILLAHDAELTADQAHMFADALKKHVDARRDELFAAQNVAESSTPTRKIPNQFYVSDANGNIITVTSLPTDTTITLLAYDTGNDLTPYQAYALSDALKAHATARRDELFGEAMEASNG